jgi:hypothetical protein
MPCLVITQSNLSDPPIRPNPAIWQRSWRVLTCSAVLVATDFSFGPNYAVPVFFVLPVISAAWYQGFRFACGLALSLTILRFLCHWAWGFPVSWDTALVNNIMRGVMLISVAYLTDQLGAQMRAVTKRQHNLEALLPICPDCGLTCLENGQWMPLNSTSRFSTATPPKTFCPECSRKRYDLHPGR